MGNAANQQIFVPPAQLDALLSQAIKNPGPSLFIELEWGRMHVKSSSSSTQMGAMPTRNKLALSLKVSCFALSNCKTDLGVFARRERACGLLQSTRTAAS